MSSRVSELSMRARLAALGLCATALIGIILVLSSGRPASAQGTGPCTAATLYGAYRYTFTGFGYPGGGNELKPTAPSVTFAAVGIATFDGSGGVTGNDTAVLGGVLRPPRTYTGRYTMVNSCRGSMAMDFCYPNGCVGTANIVAAPSGSEILFINTFESGATVTGEFKKQQ